MPTTAEIIAIGDELLYGQTLDTNSQWISQRLDEIGIKIKKRVTVGDVREEILQAFSEAQSRADVVLITGGLGPTKDDLTKPLLAEYFGVSMTFHPEIEQHIQQLFHRAGRTMSDLNRKQAELPANCDPVHNAMGTAPGMWFDADGTIFISMPGVPYEMKEMMTAIILPRLQARFAEGIIHHRIIRTIGIPESTLAERIAAWEDALPAHIRLAYLPSPGQVKLRLTAIGTDEQLLKKQVREQEDAVLPLIEKYVYGYDQDEIELKVGEWLMQRGHTIAFAESCTGGYLSHLITSIPGSSRYFKGSVVSYAYEAKSDILNVNPQTLVNDGAVSESTVKQMAENARKLLKTDVALAVSGIAGPDGGTPEKPVGTVWIAYSDAHKTVAKVFRFTKTRTLNIHFSAISALNYFRLNYLESNE